MSWADTKVVKLRYSIGIATKMIFIVTLIVISAIGVVVYIATDLFKEDSVTRVQETNKDTAVQLAERVHSVFQDSTERMTLLAQFATRSATIEEAERAIRNTITSSDDLISFTAYKFNDKNEPELQFFVASESALAEFNLDEVKLRDGIFKDLLTKQVAKPNDLILLNSSPQYGVPLFTLSFLSQQKDEALASQLVGRWWFRAEIRQDRILKLFSSKNFVTSFLVDANGKLMAHSDAEMTKSVIQGRSFINNPIVQKMFEGTNDNHQMSYVDENGDGYLGAFKKVGVAGVGVVAEVSESKALATIQRVQYRSLLVMAIVVGAAFILNFGFSQSLTSNLKKLFMATEQIVEGKFDVNPHVESSDEIGALAHAFVSMAAGLKEREKIKDAFDKFHSKEVAKKLLSGEIKLGGERKHATVFFSDIRGFTALSERMTPDQVVTMLNEYFTAMVRVVYNHKGVVDKYIGDAILAVWGVPESHGNDALSAVRASLEMRDHLVEFNRLRKMKGLPEIKMGMGVHSGDVLSGNIGAYDKKLEYTVIGDTVNQASRIEGACKALNTDFLISEATYSLVRNHGIEVGPPIQMKAKGKSNTLVVHQVIGWKDERGKLHTSLTADEINLIQNRPTEVEEAEEVKTTIYAPKKAPEKVLGPLTPPPFPTDISNANMAHNNEDENEVSWYVVSDPGSKEYQGPFSLKQISLKISEGHFNFGAAYAFKMGDSQMTPVNQIPFLNRRSEPNTIAADLPGTAIRKAAAADEWYVAGPNGQTLGPYTEDELRIALGKGNLTRTTWVWKQGLAGWIHLHQIPGFDRRAS